jgi:hypothetical protein
MDEGFKNLMKICEDSTEHFSALHHCFSPAKDFVKKMRQALEREQANSKVLWKKEPSNKTTNEQEQMIYELISFILANL